MIELQPDRRLTRAQAKSILGIWLGAPTACTEIIPLKGGMVNSVFRLRFDRDPYRAVVKIHGPGNDTFDTEAGGLEYLRSHTTCPVPRVYAHDGTADLVPHAYLLLEDVAGTCLEAADLLPAERTDIEVHLASLLRELHDHRGQSWGAIDVGGPGRSWADTFADRLTKAWALPEVSRRLPDTALSKAERSIDLARHALTESDRPALVHGDVWAGNMIVHRREEGWRVAALLDPDLQFADAEFELAYLEVFDADRTTFFDAYTGSRPLRDGYEDRRLFYWLHTALVHVGLFADEFFRHYTLRTLEQIDDTWADSGRRLITH